MNPTVYLCQLTKEWTTYEWLCREHIDARKTELNHFGLLIWFRIEPLDEIDGRCADCETRRQAARGYVTPTVVPALLKPDAAARRAA